MQKCTIFTNVTNWCYTLLMKRATVTFPDDIAKGLEQYVAAQEAPPSLTVVVQAALRQYLGERGYLRTRRTLKIRPVGRSGRRDISQKHDAYLAGIKE